MGSPTAEFFYCSILWQKYDEVGILSRACFVDTVRVRQVQDTWIYRPLFCFEYRSQGRRKVFWGGMISHLKYSYLVGRGGGGEWRSRKFGNLGCVYTTTIENDLCLHDNEIRPKRNEIVAFTTIVYTTTPENDT